MSAEHALELHNKELQPGMSLSVLVSNPERKKGRTDQDADQREIYVAGLPKLTTSDDLRKLFQEVTHLFRKVYSLKTNNLTSMAPSRT